MILPVETVNYIIEFLLMQPNRNLVSYSEVPSTAPITITPAKSIHEPVLPANIRTTTHRGGIIIHDDIIISTFFLLSRYDEYRQPLARDCHSRFCSACSFLGSHGLLQTPLVDIYTEFIYRLLSQPIPSRPRHVYLTHDIDTLSHYHRLRGFCGGILRALLRQRNSDSLSTIFRSAMNIERDPAYTFPIIETMDSLLPAAEVIYFVKPNRAKNRYDRPRYSFSSLPALKGVIGLHSLYETYDNSSLLSPSYISDIPHHFHRSHYLRILPPTEMHRYVEAGITDDFTLCYADTLGFRLGTTRPSLAINPATATVLPLTMHPLTVMDTSLVDSRYLNLDREQALNRCLTIFDIVNRHQGDITLLFHNSNFANPLIPSLYSELLNGFLSFPSTSSG